MYAEACVPIPTADCPTKLLGQMSILSKPSLWHLYNILASKILQYPSIMPFWTSVKSQGNSKLGVVIIF